MAVATPDVVSGIQPADQLHIGNYFGAVSNWVSLQHSYRCVYIVADLHAMTTAAGRERLRENTPRTVLDLLACGVDPARATLLVQSLAPEHTFLLWVLSCFCSSGELARMPQYKALADERRPSSAALLSYPVLQAADILAYRARYTPVGKDQVQHLELARSIARRFNAAYGCDLFPEPQPLFTATPRIMSLTDPARKMSKSAPGAVGLFDPEPVIRKKVRAARTDSGAPGDGPLGPGVSNLLAILKACGGREAAAEFEREYRAKGSRRYTGLKDATADALVRLSGDLTARRDKLARRERAVLAAVRERAEAARQVIRDTLSEVCRVVGLPDAAPPLA